VEAHLMQMTARLVPGITTVTTNARYFALHAFVAEVAASERLEWADAIDLLRRCEVVVAAATITHSVQNDSAAAHGAGKIAPTWQAGSIDLASMSEPGAYAKGQRGFLDVYLGSELEMGILGSSSLQPGERSNMMVLRRGFEGLTELARQGSLAHEDVVSAGHLSVHAAGVAPDGKWLARLFCASGLDVESDTDRSRRGTIELCRRSLQLGPADSFQEAMYRSVAFGSALRGDPILAAIPEGVPWRSTLLRRYSINSWRVLWAWLVDRIGDGEANVDGHTEPAYLVEQAIEACRSGTGTVGEFLDGLPQVVDEHGDPNPAEDELAGQGRSEFETALGTIALGGNRCDHFDGDALVAFAGRSRSVLDPVWVQQRFSSQALRMSDFLNGFVHDVLDRSRRIAMRRSRMQRGIYVVPGRVHEHAGRLWRTSREGRSPVGLRLSQLERNLAAVGVVERSETGPSFTAFGETLLDG
jgi:hypothetical protein